MKRLFRIGMLLILGAIINIAVAWTCVLLHHTVTRSNTSIPVEEFLSLLDDEGAEDVRSWRQFSGSTEDHAWGITTIGAGDFFWETCSGRSCQQIGICAGLPAYAMSGSAFEGNFKRLRTHFLLTTPAPWLGEVSLPFRPLWPGFAINTLIYAAIVWMLFAAPFALRRRRRLKRGLCPACAYPRGASDICTECGNFMRDINL